MTQREERNQNTGNRGEDPQPEPGAGGGTDAGIIEHAIDEHEHDITPEPPAPPASGIEEAGEGCDKLPSQPE